MTRETSRVTFLEHYLQVIRKGELTENDRMWIEAVRHIPRKHPIIPDDMMFRLCRNVIARELGLWPTPDAATFNPGAWFIGERET